LIANKLQVRCLAFANHQKNVLFFDFVLVEPPAKNFPPAEDGRHSHIFTIPGQPLRLCKESLLGSWRLVSDPLPGQTSTKVSISIALFFFKS